MSNPYGFVGWLKATPVPDLLAVPLDQYEAVPDFGDILKAHRTTRTVFGAERTVVVTYNEAWHLGQWQGEFARLRKLHEQLRALQKSLVTARRRSTRAKVEQRMAETVAVGSSRLVYRPNYCHVPRCLACRGHLS